MTWLRAWPLGDPSATRTTPPGRTRACGQHVALLGDWHDAPRGGGTPHYAQDIFAPRGTPVLSPVAGRVRFAGWGEVGGWQVSIATNGGRLQLSHLDTRPTVTTGARVEVGELVGVVGNTGGRASRLCPHLHVGVKDAHGVPVNIYPELRALAPARRVRPGPTPDSPVELPEPEPAPLDLATAQRAGTGLAGGALALFALWAAAQKATS